MPTEPKLNLDLRTMAMEEVDALLGKLHERLLVHSAILNAQLNVRKEVVERLVRDFKEEEAEALLANGAEINEEIIDEGTREDISLRSETRRLLRQIPRVSYENLLSLDEASVRPFFRQWIRRTLLEEGCVLFFEEMRGQ